MKCLRTAPCLLVLLLSCNEAPQKKQADDLPITIDSNVVRTTDSINTGIDTNDHNKGVQPTNALDTAVIH